MGSEGRAARSGALLTDDRDSYPVDSRGKWPGIRADSDVHRTLGIAELQGQRVDPEAPRGCVERTFDRLVAVERDRPKVGEVIEPVALESRAELELQREADREERTEDREGGGRDTKTNAVAASTAAITMAAMDGVCPAIALSRERRAISRPASSTAANTSTIQAP